MTILDGVLIVVVLALFGAAYYFSTKLSGNNPVEKELGKISETVYSDAEKVIKDAESVIARLDKKQDAATQKVVTDVKNAAKQVDQKVDSLTGSKK